VETSDLKPKELPKCKVHNLTLSPKGECILCAKSNHQFNKQTTETRSGWKVFAGLFLLVAIAGVGGTYWRLWDSDSAGDDTPSAAAQSTLAIPNDSYFHGTWTMTSCAGTFYTTMRPDGTTSTRLERKGSGQSAHVSRGTWKIRDGAIVWVHSRSTSRTVAGAEDVNHILNIQDDSFTIAETNGKRTAMTRFQ